MVNVLANYSEFKDKVIEAVKKEVGSGFSVSSECVTKCNGVKMDAVTIRKDNCNIGSVVYLNGYFDEYTDGKSLDKIVAEIVKVGQSEDEHKLAIDKVASDFLCYEKVKNNITFRVLSYEMNKEYLKDAAYVRRLDLALVFQIELAKDEVSVGTVVIRDNHMKEWGVDLETIYLQAFANVSKQEYLFRPITDVIGDMLDMTPAPQVDAKMWVLSNKSSVFGACVMFYPGVLKKCAEKMGLEKVYILPSSIHEVLLITTELAVTELRELVQSVNSTAVSAQEVLSQNVYVYDTNEGQLLISE